MQEEKLNGIRVALLCTDGVEQSELIKPREALDRAGAETFLVSPKDTEIQTWKHFDHSDKVKVDIPLSEASAGDFDALVLPGGVANPDQLRINKDAVAFVNGFVRAKKPIAAICHGPWTLIEAGGVDGKEMTSWPSIKTDLENAGAKWSDSRVIVDGNLVTSRKPDDLPDFNREMIELFAKSQKSKDMGEVGSESPRKSEKPSVAPSAQI